MGFLGVRCTFAPQGSPTTLKRRGEEPLGALCLLGALPAWGPGDRSWQKGAVAVPASTTYCRLIPNCSHSSPNLQVTHAAPLSTSEEPGAVFSPALPTAAEGAFAPAPEKAGDGTETDLGLQSDVGKQALAKKYISFLQLTKC